MKLFLTNLVFLMALVATGSAQDQPQPQLDARGWHSGEVASGTAAFLGDPLSVPLELPAAVTENLDGRTLLFYFSPSCPHCKAVMPSLVAFSKAHRIENLGFLGIATSHTSQTDLDAYRDLFDVDFPMQIDADRAYAMSAGLQSTPAAIVVEPRDGAWVAIAGFIPWFSGAEKLLEIQLNPDEPFSGFTPGRYMGPTVCATCHRSEANSTSLTHHTIAYATLYSRERVEEEECVRCHVTGMGQGGFEMGDHHSDFASVSCESCHSAGGPHDGESVHPRETCEGCHDSKHSIAFSYEKGLPFLDHFKADHMSEEAVRERWSALQSGQAEKPLLAFPEGPTVGHAVCKECHSTEHARWSTGPHAHSEARFAAQQESVDAECLQCHRTPSAFGLGTSAHPSDTPGVQCESCHGPGGDHVKAPSASNIVGLGDSCPECVIEEVCTNCHTPTWDPAWHLDTRLGVIRGLYSPKETP